MRISKLSHFRFIFGGRCQLSNNIKNVYICMQYIVKEIDKQEYTANIFLLYTRWLN